MAQKVRFTDPVTVSAFGSDASNAVITASADSASGILFTKGDGSTFTVPIAASASSADSLTTASVSNNTITFTKGDGDTFPLTIDTGSGGGESIEYVNAGANISSIEVGDYTNDVEVTFTNGALKFIFGNPTPPVANLGISGYNRDRFNQVLDSYTVTGNFGLGGYTLISASLFETTAGSEGLRAGPTGTGNSLSISPNTSGSRSYKLFVTSSNPATGQIEMQEKTASDSLSKNNPGRPTVNPVTANVSLGAAGNKIEIGSTGDLTFSPLLGGANGWEFVPNSLTTNVSSPITLLSSNKNNILISASANYISPAGAANPDESITMTQSPVTSYQRIRSLRFGAALRSTWTETDLENLPLWDTTLGGPVGTIYKGTVVPNNQQITTTFSGVLYMYIVYSISENPLTEILGPVGNEIGSFNSPETVGQYRVYRTSGKISGGTGATFNFTLKT